MNVRRLGSILQRILTVSVAAAGCGGIDTEGFDPLPCKNDSVEHLSGLTLADPADYLELRVVEFEGAPVEVLETFGAKCGAAADQAACEAAIAAATSPSGFPLGQCVDFCPDHYLVVNRGDDVSIITTRPELDAALGSFDSEIEAVLAAELAEYSVICSNAEEVGVKKVGQGFEVLATRYTNGCDPIEKTLYRLGVDASGKTTELESDVVESEGGCIGRRPASLHRRRPSGPTPLAAYWSGVAHLEAASIHAFAELRRELVHHGAPAALARAASRSMHDEARHALLTRRLAAAHGAIAPKPRVSRRPVRSLEAIAVENAVEGCVRETFGALVGAWQGRFARSASVRRVMRSVSRDEVRHAALALSVDAWIRRELGGAAARRVDEARRGALEALAGEARIEPHPDLVREAGVPDARSATELARRFAEAPLTRG